MNKTPEQIAEESAECFSIEYIPPAWSQPAKEVLHRDSGKIKAFLAGYHSRDSEIEKLVEVLRELMEEYDFAEGKEPPTWSTISKAKEALKPYITKTEIE